MHSTLDNSEGKTGALYIVATPLGNLEDITVRALNVLKSADLIAAEDTRHTKILLNKYDISTKLVSCHEHNESQKAGGLIAEIMDGKTICLVSDAGTPTVSDPGYILIKKAIEKKVKVIPIPGASAAITAMSVSGMPTDSFVFYGFLPKKQKSRAIVFKELGLSPRSAIFFESPRRIVELLQDIIDNAGDRPAMLAREMTKIYEEYIHGTLSEIIVQLKKKDVIKGECTLIVGAGQEKECVSEETLCDEIGDMMKKSKKTSEIARTISGRYSLSKKRVYDLVLQIKNND
jgi:16S rRNA (cytidine1402-2'-O)-methyltransferase